MMGYDTEDGSQLWLYNGVCLGPLKLTDVWAPHQRTVGAWTISKSSQRILICIQN